MFQAHVLVQWLWIGTLGLGGDFGTFKHGLGTHGLWDVETRQNQNIGCIVGHVLSNGRAWLCSSMPQLLHQL
jgi:hypothetical protein